VPIRWGIDALGAAVRLIVANPVVLIAMAAIKLCSPGSVIFNHTREGRHGRSFTIYKLRTMLADAERIQDQ
jgi:lipopolysaccharide/colanic/teichoic acid biosynthesis glycosyltransferase